MITGDGLLAHHRLRPGAGVPLVLLHGFPLDSRMWLDVVDLLPGEPDVIALDLPGMGESPTGADVAATLGAPDEPSIDVSGDAVAATLRALGVDRAVVAGLSMGGYVVMSLLARHPELVAGAALLDTKAGQDPQAARDNRLRIADELESQHNIEPVLSMRRSLLGQTSREQREDLVERLETWIRDQGPAGVAWCQRAMAPRPDRLDAIAAFDGPLLVIVGEEDELSPLDEAQKMVDAAKDAELVVVPRAGHMTTIEAPEPVASSLAALMRRV